MTNNGSVLVVDPEADRYGRRLSDAVPHADLRAATTFDETAPILDGVCAVITMGVGTGLGLTRELIASMSNLLWVQGLVAGFEHLSDALRTRPEVLLTTARGIHGRRWLRRSFCTCSCSPAR